MFILTIQHYQSHLPLKCHPKFYTDYIFKFYQLPLTLTALLYVDMINIYSHNDLIKVIAVAIDTVYQVNMTLYFLNDVDDVESTLKSIIRSYLQVWRVNQWVNW